MIAATLYRPLTLPELYRFEIPPREWVVDELLPRGSLTLLAAREKAGKSLLAVDLCCSVAAGEPFLDRAVTPGPTLLVPAEDHIREIQDRMRTRLDGRDDPPVLVLPVNGFTDDCIRLEDPASLQGLYDVLDREEIAVAVLDPMRELHQQREDSADDMGPLLKPLRQMAHQTHTAIVLVHHQARSGHARGSTAIKAAADQEWAFSRAGGDEDMPQPEVRGTMRIEGRFGPPITLHIQLGELLRWSLSDGLPPEHDRGASRGRVLRLLQDSADWLDARAIADALPLPLKTVQNAISLLLKEHPPLIVCRGSGRKNDAREYHAVDPVLLTLEQCGMVPDSRYLYGDGNREPIARSLQTVN
jgi:hypothetical protein